MDGDPRALFATYSSWVEDAARIEDLAGTAASVRAGLGGRWSGSGAAGFQKASSEWERHLEEAATPLRRAAEGLAGLASEMGAVQADADSEVESFLKMLQRAREYFNALPSEVRASAVTGLIADVYNSARQSAATIGRLADRLDTYLGEMPPLFVIPAGDVPAAAPVNAEHQRTSTVRASGVVATKVYGKLNARREEGLTVTENTDGSVVVGLSDGYNGGTFYDGEVGVKVKNLPDEVQEKLGAAFGVVGANADVSYVKRYKFDSAEEANEFLTGLQGETLAGKATRVVADGVGFFTGPLGDFNPWHDDLTGQKPDEVAYNVKLDGKIIGGAYVGPTDGIDSLGGRATGGGVAAGGGVTGTFTDRADGSYARGWSANFDAAVGGGVNAGEGGAVVNAGPGVSKATSYSTSYGVDGEPETYTRVETRNSEKVSGSGSLDAGAFNVGPGDSDGGSGNKNKSELKMDVESQKRVVETTTLDLTDPVNSKAYRDMATSPPGSDENEFFGYLIDQNGTTSGAEYDVRKITQGVQAGGAELGGRVEGESEEVQLVDRWFVDADGKRHSTDNLSEPGPDEIYDVPLQPAEPIG
ncbi:MAG: WXG100 family type VII secretion target [Phycicoccus sp.]